MFFSVDVVVTDVCVTLQHDSSSPLSAGGAAAAADAPWVVKVSVFLQDEGVKNDHHGLVFASAFCFVHQVTTKSILCFVQFRFIFVKKLL